jgi:hypothetical protein
MISEERLKERDELKAALGNKDVTDIDGDLCRRISALEQERDAAVMGMEKMMAFIKDYRERTDNVNCKTCDEFTDAAYAFLESLGLESFSGPALATLPASLETLKREREDAQDARKNAEKWKLQYDHLISSMKTDGGKFKCMSCGGDCVPWSRVEAMNKEIIVERQRHKMAEEVFKAEYKKLDEAYRKERGI